MEKKNLKTIYGLIFKSGHAVRYVNLITLYRVATSPLLLVLAFTNQLDIFKWMLLASFTTDAIDGFLARKYKATSILGAKLDSIGDDLTILVAVIAVFITYPEFFREEKFIILGMLGLFFLQLFYALAKYKRPTSFHTYLAKAAAILQGFSLLSLFFFETIVYSLFYTASIVTSVELIEEIIIVMLLPEWKNDVKGLFWVLKKRKEKIKRNGNLRFAFH